ncbi:MAG: hypothetical protein J6334_03770 [Kiritimatiellae bacterium]|nr:hypothetical protein [Kiritimatiellia bacterium]
MNRFLQIVMATVVGAMALSVSPCRGADTEKVLWRLPSPERRTLDEQNKGPMMPPDLLPDTLTSFTISAWVKPHAFTRYNELFRIESDRGRVLFSFQENGRILSFGLHGSSYVECDGPIDPAVAANGKWHQVVASLDKGEMRVWMDGSERNAIQLPGGHAVVARGVPGWVGSSGGTGEFFNGELDALTLYAHSVTPADVLKAFAAECAAYGAAFDVDAVRAGYAARRDRICEFRPLTPEQEARCGAAEREKWARFDALWRATFPQGLEQATLDQLIAAASVAWPSPPLRPEQEPVAPFHPPVTPPPRQLSPVEATLAIEADWLWQADGTFDPKDEWARTERLAQRLGAGAALTAELRALVAAAQSPEEKTAAYLAVRRVKRAIMFGNPLVQAIKRLLILDSPYPEGSENWHETRHRLGYMGVPGGQLIVLDGLRPDGKVTRLAPKAPLSGHFWRPDVSYDGSRILFCFKPHNEKTFHIYEMDADGGNCRQLTSGIFDDLDPIYLPDGKHYVFTSTRGHTYVRCMPPTNAYALMRGTFGDDDLYFISANNEPDYLPSVLNDGRIVYTRWEYTDKPLWRAQSLWTVNPDGTQANTLWGNQSVWPDVLKDARAIPGSHRVIFTGSAHHSWFSGSIGILDPDIGSNFPNGLRKVTRERPWPECGNGPTDPAESDDYRPYGKWEAYISPWPLSEKDFLVGIRRAGRFSLYLMDTDGNRELVYTGVNNIFHFIPLQARPKPPVVADRITFPERAERLTPADGTIYSPDVHEGVPEKMKGKIKFLRVWYLEQKTYTYWNHRPALSTGPVVSGVQTDGVKRYLGEVPVHPDGSVWFRAPSGLALHFQALDGNHRALQTMRSFTSLQPGEMRGCTGCHERTSGASAAVLPANRGAFRKPDTIRPAPWAPEGARTGVAIGYLHDIVPIFKKHCYACHTGEGKGRATFDLTENGWRPYMEIVGWPGWGTTDTFPGQWAGVVKSGWPTIDPKAPPPGYDLAGTIKVENYPVTAPAAYITPEPMTRLSYQSRLVRLISGEANHHNVKGSDEDLLKTILWVDAICPYLTDAEIRKEKDPVFPGSDWLSQKPRLETAPLPVRPGPFSAHADPETVAREYAFPPGSK